MSRPTPSKAMAQVTLSTIMPPRIDGENRQSCELETCQPSRITASNSGRNQGWERPTEARAWHIQASAPVLKPPPAAPDRLARTRPIRKQSPAGPRRAAKGTGGASPPSTTTADVPGATPRARVPPVEGPRRRDRRSRAEGLGNTRGIMKTTLFPQAASTVRPRIRWEHEDFIIVIVFVAAEKYEISRSLVAPHGEGYHNH